MSNPTNAEWKKLNKALKEQLKDANTKARELGEEVSKLRGAPPAEAPAIKLPDGYESFEALIEELNRRELVIVAQEEKLGYAVPDKYAGMGLPQAKENILYQQLEREFNELNRNYTKLHEAKKKDGVDVSEVMEPPKSKEKPQDHLPVDCLMCGLRVPNRFEGAKEDPTDGGWFCVQNGCADEKNLA